MPRVMLSDELWSKLEKILLQQTIYHKPDLRLTVEGMLYRMRVGCPWRDLPSAFGCWNSVYKRFNAWSVAGKWLKVFNTLIEDGVRGAMEQKVHLSPVPARKPLCGLDGSIKPPFYETASAIAKKGHQHPKISAINPFRKSKFVNSQ
jgi:transposase